MRTARIIIDVGDIIAAVPGNGHRSPAAIAIARVVPQGVDVIDNGGDVLFRLPGGSWRGSDLPGVACDFGVFYEGRQNVIPIVFDLDVPDETDAGLAA